MANEDTMESTVRYNREYYEKVGRQKYLERVEKLDEKEFLCEICAYYTRFKSNFSVHLKSKKHIKRTSQ